MKFAYYNDTKRVVTIHPGTEMYITKGDISPIKHGEIRYFEIEDGHYPIIKMWDYGDRGLQIFLSSKPICGDDNNDKNTGLHLKK